MAEESTLTGRLRRYADVSTSLGGSAMRLLGAQVFGSTLDHDQMALNLTQAFGSLKGPAMKVLQMLATIPDAIPHEYAQEFQQLQSNAPPMTWPFVRRRMIAELGPDWATRFKEFAHESSAAASLGQVHKAVAHDGTKLACKLQYPNMSSVMEADLLQLKVVLKMYEATMGALKTEDLLAEISERLKEELDYVHEAHNIDVYTQILQGQPGVYLPRVLPDLSTKRLLSMTWLEGEPLLKAVKSRSQEARNMLAQRLFRAWYEPFYHFGYIHGDPHLGNYTVRTDDGLNLLDFGCVRRFDPTFVNGVVELYQAFKHEDTARAVHAYEIWGFENLSHEMIEVLNHWAALLYEPLISDTIRPIQDNQSGVRGRETAAHVHAELRRLGGIRPPRSFVFMDRAAVGIGSAFMHLGAELNWHQLFESLIDDFTEEGLRARQAGLSSNEP